MKVGTNYSYRYYYYGNADVAIDYFNIDRYHQKVIQKGADWRVYSSGQSDGKMYINWLIWHPDGSYTSKNYILGTNQYRKWHHIVCTYEKNNKMKIYIDGELKGNWNAPDKSIRQLTQNPYLGYQNQLEIHDIRIYNRVLTDSEISNNYNGQVSTNGLIHWWKLDEGTGGIVHDAAGNSYGILEGAKWHRYAQHSYTNSGTYPVTLTVEDNYGMNDSITKIISFANSDNPETYISNGPSGTISYKNVSFEWSGSDDTTPVESLAYSYKLEGYDSDWSPWTTNTTENYKNLPNGDYTFKVKSKDLDGNIDTTPATQEFTVHIDTPPVINDYSPVDDADNVIQHPQLSVTISDSDSVSLSITFYTNASGSWNPIESFTGGNGVYTVNNVSLMNNWFTRYWWSVNITDGNNWINQTYTFTTKPADWDIKIDNKIDINDITAVTAHYGETGDTGWIRADVIKDGKININDITAITAHYGENYA